VVPPQWLAVVKPPEAIATAEIFSSPLMTRDTKSATVAGLLADMQQRVTVPQDKHHGASKEAFFGRNDLQPAAEAICPGVVQVARWLEGRFGNSRMTGSGSAVFASAGTDVQPVATWPEGDLPQGWVGRMCRSLAQHPLAGWAD
jgi:4-diphosphocytidyl-2-C-methyl-D-erythritol kinase